MVLYSGGKQKDQPAGNSPEQHSRQLTANQQFQKKCFLPRPRPIERGGATNTPLQACGQYVKKNVMLMTF